MHWLALAWDICRLIVAFLGICMIVLISFIGIVVAKDIWGISNQSAALRESEKPIKRDGCCKGA